MPDDETLAKALDDITSQAARAATAGKTLLERLPDGGAEVAHEAARVLGDVSERLETLEDLQQWQKLELKAMGSPPADPTGGNPAPPEAPPTSPPSSPPAPPTTPPTPPAPATVPPAGTPGQKPKKRGVRMLGWLRPRRRPKASKP